MVKIDKLPKNAWQTWRRGVLLGLAVASYFLLGFAGLVLLLSFAPGLPGTAIPALAVPSVTTQFSPTLAIPDRVAALAGKSVTLPILYTANDQRIASLLFEIDYDHTLVRFDPTDSDNNGIPDAVVFNRSLPTNFVKSVTFTAGDTDGELDFVVADFSPTPQALADSAILSLTLQVTSTIAAGVEANVTFSAASFGNTANQEVPGETDPGSILITQLPAVQNVFLPTVVRPCSQLAFVSNRTGNFEIYTMKLDGRTLTNLTNHPAWDSIPDWSPDGKRIAFESDRDGNWEIYVMNSDGSDLARLTNNAAEDHDPHWSPDGRSLLFHSNRDSGVWQIWQIDITTHLQTKVTSNPANNWAAAWSPDGNQIVYTNNFPGPGEIYIANADGSQPVNLTNSVTHESVANWSPDGKHIVFYADRNNNRDIYVMNADGSNQTRLTTDPANDELADWCADGQVLTLTSGRDGNPEIYTMKPDGSGVVRLTNHPADDFNAVWSSASNSN